MSRNFRLGIIMAVLTLAVAELISWGLLNLAMRLNALRLYSSEFFSRISDEELKRAAGQGPLGWPSNEVPRAAPATHSPICGSAFGDSMTYASEVDDAEAWVHLLSLRLGCTVTNYAVPAHGLDQTLLRYERVASEGEFVILGLFIEMVRRNVAASWTFYSLGHPMTISSLKPYFSLDDGHLRLHSIPDPLSREMIAAHHAGDYYMRHASTAMHFPYLMTAAQALHIRIMRTDDYRSNPEKYLNPEHPSGSGMLARRLIDRFAQIARQRNARLAVVLIPYPGRLVIDSPWERQFADDLGGHAEICVLDLKPALREHARPLGGKAPQAPAGHYTAIGNRWIADAVASGLRDCGK
jgi:hypothetical protein